MQVSEPVHVNSFWSGVLPIRSLRHFGLWLLISGVGFLTARGVLWLLNGTNRPLHIASIVAGAAFGALAMHTTTRRQRFALTPTDGRSIAGISAWLGALIERQHYRLDPDQSKDGVRVFVNDLALRWGWPGWEIRVESGDERITTEGPRLTIALLYSGVQARWPTPESAGSQRAAYNAGRRFRRWLDRVRSSR